MGGLTSSRDTKVSPLLSLTPFGWEWHLFTWGVKASGKRRIALAALPKRALAQTTGSPWG